MSFWAMTAKADLRREAIRHRERIEPGPNEGEEATALFFEHIKPRKDQVIALYWAKRREFSTDALLDRLLSDGYICALPVMQAESKILKFARWRDGEPLVTGAYDLQEPAGAEWVEPDIVIVPLLSFDTRGNRLGYGGGYYDATLAALRTGKSILAVGWAYAEQAVLFGLPTERHDEKLDWIVTPQKAHCFIL